MQTDTTMSAKLSSARAGFLLQAATPSNVVMGQLMGGRRAALEGLARILDAGAPEELFTGPEDGAIFLYELLVDSARARGSSYYWEICRTARRRGVTPEYVVDRAVVLLATIEERRRADLYRILGVPPLSSAEMIRQRWLELAKQHHPDIGGDGAIFRQAKEAYEILRDSARRAEYERFWLRALGPFERVASREEVPLLTAMGGAPHGWTRTQARETPAPPVAEPAPPAEDAGGGIHALFARAEALLAPVATADVTALHADVAGTIAELERISAELSALAAVKRALQA
jgi:hypothetical protein